MKDKSIKIKIETTIPLPEKERQALSSKAPCGACGKCGQKQLSNEAEKTDPSASLRMTGSPLLQHAGETLLNLAGGAYTLEQLSTALEIIETLLKRHYDNQK